MAGLKPESIQYGACPRCGNAVTSSDVECSECVLSKPYQRALERGSNVTVTGIDVSFWDLMVLFLKAAFASIPAATILAVVGWFVAALFFGGPGF